MEKYQPEINFSAPSFENLEKEQEKEGKDGGRRSREEIEHVWFS